MGNGSALNGLPPLPQGATLNSAPPAGAALPPLPPGATLNTAPATPPAAPPSGGTVMPGTGGEDDPYARFSSGFSKSLGQVAGNVLDLYGKAMNHVPGGGQSFEASRAEVQGHLKQASTWLRSGGQPEGFWEHVGAIGEQALEYIGTDGLLKMVGPAAAAAETGEHLKGAQQAAQTVAKNPKLAGLLMIGLKASKDALMQGSQTYLHTLDAGEAAAAGATGGVLRAAGEGVGAAARWLKGKGPTSLEVAGEKVPVLKDQLNEHGEPTGTNASEAPKIAAEQQRAAQAVIANTAKQGTSNALTWLNTIGRRASAAAPEGVPRLAPPEGAEPFTFTLEGPGTQEGRTGRMAIDPRKQHLGTRVVERAPRAEGPDGRSMGEPLQGVGEKAQGSNVRQIDPATGEGPALDPNKPVSTNANKLVKEPVFQYKTGAKPGSPDPMEDVATGGGNLVTTNPHEATSWLQQLEEIKASPAFDDLPPAQQGRIEAQRKALQDQLTLYHASPYNQHFGEVDVNAATEHVRTFGDSQAQIQNAAKPVYQKLDQLSDNEFSKWNGAAKQAEKVIRSATSMDAVDAAQVRLSEANEAINNLITRHGGEMSQTDYHAARSAWRDSMVFGGLHTRMERMMNGITVDEADRGMTRIMTGKTEALEKWLAEDGNRSHVERLIGRDGVTNLKRMTELLSNQKSARATTTVSRNVVEYLGQHARIGGAGGLLGGLVASHMGVPWFEGVAAGAGAAEGIRMVLRSAATSPRIGNMVDFAVKHGIDPKIYAPLISRALTEPLQEQAPEDDQKPANEPGQEKR